ncbi:MAG: GyrI-like domain-containing protein [Planctomycetota bacterium]
MDIQRVSRPEQHYLYVERTATYEGSSIAEAMGSGFGEVTGFAKQYGIECLSMPCSIYVEMPGPTGMAFRAAIFVTAEDAAKAEGDIKAGSIAAGEAYTATHRGSYASMDQSHNAVWERMDSDGVTKSMPIWEIYADDPTLVPEAECRTEVFRAVGS